MSNVHYTNNLNLSLDSISQPIEITGKGAISIQPYLLESVIGTPKYTLEVSIDGYNFTEYHPSSTKVSVDDSIQILSDILPWKYIRIKINRTTSDLGSVIFRIYENG